MAERRSSRTRGADFPFETEDALAHLTRSDAKLASVIERTGAFLLKVDAVATPFEALAESILYQQITGKAAAAILARFRARVGEGRFPSPERVLEAEEALLREVGISRGKVAALRDLAVKSMDGTVPAMRRLRGMDDEEIVERLTVVRGIGRWTAEMFLIFRLGRPDVLPVHDYGVRKGYQRAFRTRGLPEPKSIARRGERWRPYRTVASWYLWRVLEWE
jgi:3-methyladenine DNA glycosylase/8-oxoguanine DNA glycosylase